ncbi:acid-sensing ion channel 5-like [Clytia hemisphaerica]
MFQDKAKIACQRECPVPCEIESLKVETGQYAIGTKSTYKRFAALRNTTEEEGKNFISNNVVGLTVSYDDVMYIQEKLTPSVDWEILLATIGGSLGLCLGCSFITIVEFLVFLLIDLPFGGRKK